MRLSPAYYTNHQSMNEALYAAASALRAQLAHYAQDTRLLRLHTSTGSDVLIVEKSAVMRL